MRGPPWYHFPMLTNPPVTIIGVDAATQFRKTGLARGRCSDSGVVLEDIALGSAKATPQDLITAWMREAAGPVLLAVDAPLGWPRGLSVELAGHRAGARLVRPADALFRRETDLFVQARHGKRPLDVGADRIARTAHSALGLLEALRVGTGHQIPLAWSAVFAGPAAVEVYPAATLRSLGVDGGRYKSEESAREVLVDGLVESGVVSFDGVAVRQAALDTDHGLDAALCVLAGRDFLLGLCDQPADIDLAEREGWIWVRRPEGDIE